MRSHRRKPCNGPSRRSRLCPGCPSAGPTTTSGRAPTTLFAAMNVADGIVITSLHRRQRAVEFKKFLAKIDQLPENLEVHLVCDNYGTHSTRSSRPRLRHTRETPAFTAPARRG